MYTVHIDETTIEGQDVSALTFEDAPSVGVSFPGEEGVPEYRCTECGEVSESEPDALAEGAPVPVDALCPSTECKTCEGTGYAPGSDEDECETCGATGNGAHVWEVEPHGWVNSASIWADEESVNVRISVGDPRGAFLMSVGHYVYTDDDGSEVDELRLSVPSPDDTMPHMGLVPLGSSGYYRIVASESPEHVKAREDARAQAETLAWADKARKAIARAAQAMDRAREIDTQDARERQDMRAIALANLLDEMGM